MPIRFLNKNKKTIRCFQKNRVFLIALLFTVFTYVSNGTPSELKAVFSDTIRIPGWKLAGQPYCYTPHNLYTYINGAADFFIAYGFIGLAGANYTPVTGSQDSITIDVYDMDEKLNAFGVFQSRRDRSSPTLQIGTKAVETQDYLVFYKNRYYVEIQAFISSEIQKTLLATIAKKVAERLPGDISLPHELSCFPEKGMVNGSERYIRGGILGHAFLDRGIICEYQIGCENISAFVAFFQSSGGAHQSLQQYKSFLQKSGKHCRLLIGLGDWGITSEEPYHKKIIVVQQGAFIVGAYELNTIEPGRKLLEDILYRLK